MFESLSDKLDAAFKNLKGQARITDLNIAATLKTFAVHWLMRM